MNQEQLIAILATSTAPCRGGGIDVSGKPWTGGNPEDTGREMISNSCLRPRNNQELFPIEDKATKGLDHQLGVPGAPDNSITFVSWMEQVAHHLKEHGMDSVFYLPRKGTTSPLYFAATDWGKFTMEDVDHFLRSGLDNFDFQNLDWSGEFFKKSISKDLWEHIRPGLECNRAGLKILVAIADFYRRSASAPVRSLMHQLNEMSLIKTPGEDVESLAAMVSDLASEIEGFGHTPPDLAEAVAALFLESSSQVFSVHATVIHEKTRAFKDPLHWRDAICQLKEVYTSLKDQGLWSAIQQASSTTDAAPAAMPKAMIQEEVIDDAFEESSGDEWSSVSHEDERKPAASVVYQSRVDRGTIELLDAVGVKALKKKNHQKWLENYNNFVAHQNSQSKYLDTKTGEWAVRQRKNKRKNALSLDRVLLLNHVGFDWDPVETQRLEWMNKCNQVEAFKKQNKGSLIGMNLALQQWLQFQKKCWSRGTLKLERAKLLADIGIDWALCKSSKESQSEQGLAAGKGSAEESAVQVAASSDFKLPCAKGPVCDVKMTARESRRAKAPPVHSPASEELEAGGLSAKSEVPSVQPSSVRPPKRIEVGKQIGKLFEVDGKPKYFIGTVIRYEMFEAEDGSLQWGYLIHYDEDGDAEHLPEDEVEGLLVQPECMALNKENVNMSVNGSIVGKTKVAPTQVEMLGSETTQPALTNNRKRRACTPIEFTHFRRFKVQSGKYISCRARRQIKLLYIHDIQSYTEIMERDLRAMENDSPLNTTVEQVLPGARSEISAIRGEASKVDAKVDSVNSRLDKMDQKLDGMSDIQKLTAAFQLVISGQSPMTNLQPPSSPKIGTAAVNPADTIVNATQNIEPPSQFYRPSASHSSLTSVWDEWHGSGNFHGRPIMGGLKQLEQSKGSSWRAHFAPSEKTAFSRMKAIIHGVENYAASKGYSSGTAVAELDEIFMGSDVKCQLAKMVSWFQNRSFVTKKTGKE